MGAALKYMVFGVEGTIKLKIKSHLVSGVLLPGGITWEVFSFVCGITYILPTWHFFGSQCLLTCGIFSARGILFCYFVLYLLGFFPFVAFFVSQHFPSAIFQAHRPCKAKNLAPPFFFLLFLHSAGFLGGLPFANHSL